MLEMLTKTKQWMPDESKTHRGDLFMKIYDEHCSRNASQAGTRNLQTYFHKTARIKSGLTFQKLNTEKKETSRQRNDANSSSRVESMRSKSNSKSRYSKHVNIANRKEDIYKRISEYVKIFDNKNKVDWASGKKKWREFESKGGFKQNMGFCFISPKKTNLKQSLPGFTRYANCLTGTKFYDEEENDF